MMEKLVQMLMSAARMSIIALTKPIVRTVKVDLIVNAELGTVEMDINAQVNMNIANCFGIHIVSGQCFWRCFVRLLV